MVFADVPLAIGLFRLGDDHLRGSEEVAVVGPFRLQPHQVGLKALAVEPQFTEELAADLSYMPLLPIISDIERTGKSVFMVNYDASMIPSSEEMDYITQLDDVAMVGYPNGIWDHVNNQPIFRKGSLATRPSKRYNGNKEFLIDMPVFGGSSGSPILIASDKMYFDRRTKNYRGNFTLKLLGVVYVVMLHSVMGEVEVVSIRDMETKTATRTPLFRVPNNLGMVISAERILEIEKELTDIFADK